MYFQLQIGGHLHNTGQFLVFRADKESKVRVNITGGPLAYHYQFEEIYIHYGMDDSHGSEHRVNDYAFPAEVSHNSYSSILNGLLAALDFYIRTTNITECQLNFFTSTNVILFAVEHI